MLTTPVLITATIVVFVMAVAGAAVMFYREYAGARSLDERLGRLTPGGARTMGRDEDAGILLPTTESKGFLAEIMPEIPTLGKLFEQAEFKRTPTEFWGATGGLAILGFGLPVLLNMPIMLAPITAVLLGVVPIGYVLFLRTHRLNKLAAQLCEALELIARALRAGHSLASGLHVVAEEMPPPICNEFGRVYEEQNLGLSLEQSLRNLSDRVPNMDLKFFVTAVIIQRQTGGDLAEILDKIGYVIRERFKIQGMVKALTGEGRISGVVLIALPFGLLFLMMAISPDYISMLWTDPLGQKMSVFGIVMMIIGAAMIRKIVNIKI